MTHYPNTGYSALCGSLPKWPVVLPELCSRTDLPTCAKCLAAAQRPGLRATLAAAGYTLPPIAQPRVYGAAWADEYGRPVGARVTAANERDARRMLARKLGVTGADARRLRVEVVE